MGVAALPELLDELLALFVGGKLQECRPLFRLNNISHLFIQPLPVRGIEFFEGLLGLPLALFFGKLPGFFILAIRGLHGWWHHQPG